MEPVGDVADRPEAVTGSSTLRPTLIGGTAVLMWSTLALFTALSGTVPPFQLAAMAFSVAFAITLVKWSREAGGIVTHFRLPPKVWALGVGGLFGYHFFYFMALRNAPPVEAGLIAYLWPLLIVLFSALLPGERLRWYHVLGALLGLAGAALLVSGGQGFTLKAEYGDGYLYAILCALTWSSYSVLSRRFSHISTDAVGAFCGATALLSILCHLLFETTQVPIGGEWAAILMLGLGPVGLAFFTWDHGVKHGDIRVLGALSYAAPLLSTLVLIIFGLGEATSLLAIACGLIVGGAVLASKDFFSDT